MADDFTLIRTLCFFMSRQEKSRPPSKYDSIFAQQHLQERVVWSTLDLPKLNNFQAILGSKLCCAHAVISVRQWIRSPLKHFPAVHVPDVVLAGVAVYEKFLSNHIWYELAYRTALVCSFPLELTSFVRPSLKLKVRSLVFLLLTSSRTFSFQKEMLWCLVLKVNNNDKILALGGK